MKPLNEVVAIVARIADNEGLTPFGLLDYLRDMDRNQEYYGDKQAAIEERMFGGTGITPEDVNSKICGLATSYHLQSIRDSIRAWQKEADEKGIPITCVLVGDSELGYEAVMRDRFGKGLVRQQNAGDPIPNAKRASTKIQGPVVLGQPIIALAWWMGAEGWDIHDAKEALAMYGGEPSDVDLLAWLKSGRDGTETGNIPESVQDKLREALE